MWLSGLTGFFGEGMSAAQDTVCAAAGRAEKKRSVVVG